MKTGIETGNAGLWWDLTSEVMCVLKPPHYLDFSSASATKTSSWKNLQVVHLQNLTVCAFSAKMLISRAQLYTVELNGQKTSGLTSAAKEDVETFGKSATSWKPSHPAAGFSGRAWGWEETHGAVPSGRRLLTLCMVCCEVLTHRTKTWQHFKIQEICLMSDSVWFWKRERSHYEVARWLLIAFLLPPCSPNDCFSFSLCILPRIVPWKARRRHCPITARPSASHLFCQSCQNSGIAKLRYCKPLVLCLGGEDRRDPLLGK